MLCSSFLLFKWTFIEYETVTLAYTNSCFRINIVQQHVSYRENYI